MLSDAPIQFGFLKKKLIKKPVYSFNLAIDTYDMSGMLSLSFFSIET
jgi:hypothetical protein